MILTSTDVEIKPSARILEYRLMDKPETNKDQPKTLEEKVEDIDKRLIGQEPRIFNIIGNLYKHGFEKKDGERFIQAGMSLVSYFLKRQATVIAAAGLASVMSIASFVVSFQSKNLLQDQNNKIEMQNQLLEADRRSSLVFLFNNALDALDKELTAPKDSSQRVQDKKGNYIKLSKSLTARISELSHRLLPYRMYDYDAGGLGVLSSPERGQLLGNLIKSGVDSISLRIIYDNSTFAYADLGNRNLPRTYLNMILLSNANLTDANLMYAYLRGANLTDADLKNAYIYKSDKNDTLITHGGFIENLKGQAVTGWQRIDNLYQLTKSIEVDTVKTDSVGRNGQEIFQYDTTWVYRLEPRDQ